VAGTAFAGMLHGTRFKIRSKRISQYHFSMSITTFDSFRSRNFRLFFMGQSLSLIGTWMQKTAVSWVIYSITQSKFMLGVSVFATLFPASVFSLFGGIVADRYDRYKVLLTTQILSLIQAVLLTAAVVFFKQFVVWEIIILSAVLGIINGFDVPARQSLVHELVDDKRNLPNALALNSSMVNLSKFIGPALAGFILEKFGNQVCFGLNAVSFIPVIISLLLMKLPRHQPKSKADRNIRREFREAFAFIKATPAISSTIIFAGIMSLLVLPYSTLTPVYAKDIFNGNATTLGVIDGFIGLGAFVGALFLASLKAGTNLSKVLATNTLIFGSGLILFSYTTLYPLALVFVTFGAFGMMSVVTISNTLIQLHVTHELRGRVLSIFVMVFAGAVPIGSLLVGAVSHYIGVQATVLTEGIIALAVATMYARYLKKQKLHKDQETALDKQREEVLIQA
jgi:MFS family permease